MTNIVVMGECMVEFSPGFENTYQQSFAGDVYNTAIYLKRLLADSVNVSVLTAIGTDSLSQQMLQVFEQEQLQTSLIQKLANKQMGAYLIQKTAQGERSFIYWRDSSAAKEMFANIPPDCEKVLLESTDIFYFSGISIAILNHKDRENFWQLVEKMHLAGVSIVFDSNFRSKLWKNKLDAIGQFYQAFRYSHIVFAGVEDFDGLFDVTSYEDISQYLRPFDIGEVIIKSGSNKMQCISKNECFYVPVDRVENVVDTTSAGDSFNAGYLTAKLQQKPLKDCASYAAKIAAIVIQHSGAIVDKKQFTSSL